MDFLKKYPYRECTFFFRLASIIRHNYWDVVACISSSFLMTADLFSLEQIHHHLPVHLVMDIWVVLCVLAFTDRAVRNISVQISTQMCAFISLAYTCGWNC